MKFNVTRRKGKMAYLDGDVFNVALERLIELYSAGHRLIVAFSGGKDSTVCLELCILAATLTNRLPVEALTRDEEIMHPGTYEYIHRVYQREEVKFDHLMTRHFNSNAFNRADPWWFTFDPRMHPSEWVREPPPYALVMDEPDIIKMVTEERYPPAPGKELFSVMGLRAQESHARRYSVFAAKGHLTKKNKYGARNCRPIYDWYSQDVWKSILDNKWDYNEAYTAMVRIGVPMANMRLAPPMMSANAAEQLKYLERLWPKWFEAVCRRCPGSRLAASFGKKAVLPQRKLNETWEQCFQRVNIDQAPEFVRERAAIVREKVLKAHSRHSTSPLPEATACRECTGRLGSWRTMTLSLYNGDPHIAKTSGMLPNPEATMKLPWFEKPGLEWMRGDGLTYEQWKDRASKHWARHGIEAQNT